MKRTLLLLLVSSSTAFGQITLTDQNFPGGGESYIFSTLTDQTIDFATTGANYVWDFSNLVPQDQRGLITKPSSQITGLSIIQFGSFAPAPYKATYFNATTDLPIDQASAFLPIQIDELNSFTRNTPTAINSIGYELVSSGQGIGFRSDTIETRYVLPLTYGNNYESRGYTNLDLNPIYDAKWRQHRHRVSSVDGWGSITTPFGQFPALRIHHVINEFDSIYITVQGFSLWLPIPLPLAHEYEWRSTADKEAILRIRTNEIAGNETVTGIEYRDNFNGLGLDELAVDFSVYPNPVVNELHVKLNQKVDFLFVVSTSGQVLKSISLNANESIINVSDLSSGSYQLIVVSGNAAKALTFIK